MTELEPIGDVWGPAKVPEPEEGFRAHMSLGYSNAVGPVERSLPPPRINSSPA